MGYSVGIHARNKALKEKMLSFMEKEYRPHWQIRGLTHRDCYSSPVSDDLSYFHGKMAIGIDFNAAGFERGYAFTVVRWMALKVGQTRKTFKDPKARFEEAVPYMVYDGCDSWPVLVKPLSSVPKKIRWCCVDRYGVKLDPKQSEDYAFELEDFLAFNKAQRKACEKHGIDPDNWPEVEPPGIRWKIHDTRSQLLWPLVKPILEPIRTEMKRLDKAWSKL